MSAPGEVPLNVTMDFLSRQIQRLPAEQQWQALYTIVASFAQRTEPQEFRDTVLSAITECNRRSFRPRRSA